MLALFEDDILGKPYFGMLFQRNPILKMAMSIFSPETA